MVMTSSRESSNLNYHSVLLSKLRHVAYHWMQNDEVVQKKTNFDISHISNKKNKYDKLDLFNTQ